jgi:phosphate/sulfate permease
MLNKRSRYLIKALNRLLVASFVALNLSIIVYARNESTAKNEPSIRTVQNQTNTQDAPAEGHIGVNPNPSQPNTIVPDYGVTSEREFYLTVLVAVVGVFTLLMQFLLLKKSTRLKSEDTTRVFGITLIIMSTLFSLTAGFDAEQIAPAVGLFGTIAGYLLGRSERKEREGHA